MKVVRKDVYFTEPGAENTDGVVDAVLERVEEARIREVIVASNRGGTALKLGGKLKGKARLISISEYEYDEKTRKELEKLDVTMIEKCPAPVHDMVELRKALYMFGQGLKVAVEVAVIAADQGVVKKYTDVIGVGGTSRGADAAAIVRATPKEDIYSSDPKKRMEIREIIAMPLKK